MTTPKHCIDINSFKTTVASLISSLNIINKRYCPNTVFRPKIFYLPLRAWNKQLNSILSSFEVKISQYVV